MEKLNIAELLKDCPSGMELDSTIVDGLYFYEVTENNTIKCYIKRSYKHTSTCNSICFYSDGSYLNYTNAKCVIFPKGKTTWDGFQRPFKDGDILVSRSNQPFIFKKLNNCDGCFSYCGIDCGGGFELASSDWTFANSLRFATEEEKEKLFKAIKENGYKWNPETKTLEKLIEPKFKVGDRIKHRLTGDVYKVLFVLSNGYGGGVYDVAITNEIGKSIDIKEQDEYELLPNKFDISTLKPFESRVLVRDHKSEIWFPAIWGWYDENANCHYGVISGVSFIHCIPYEGNEHLLGTTNDCDDFYKTWK